MELRTPHSLIRFPNIRNPMSERDFGATSPTTTVMTMGKRIFVFWETEWGS